MVQFGRTAPGARRFACAVTGGRLIGGRADDPTPSPLTPQNSPLAAPDLNASVVLRFDAHDPAIRWSAGAVSAIVPVARSVQIARHIAESTENSAAVSGVPDGRAAHQAAIVSRCLSMTARVVAPTNLGCHRALGESLVVRQRSAAAMTRAVAAAPVAQRPARSRSRAPARPSGAAGRGMSTGTSKDV